jgi:FMN-dependent NADH-azoreductase
MTKILHLSSSTSGSASITDLLAGELIDRLSADVADAAVTVTRRDLRHLPLLTEAATAERGLPVEERSDEGRRDLAIADELIAELLAADAIVIGAPIYNFGPPASLKAWADLVASPGTTFGYTEAGPHGLVPDRPVFIVAASGGTPVGSEIDFGTTWLRQYLAFLGLTSVELIRAERVAFGAEASIAAAREQIAAVEPLAFVS